MVSLVSHLLLVTYLSFATCCCWLQLRFSSGPKEIAQNDIVRIFLMACEVKSVKLSVIGLSCIQKLLSNDAVMASSLGDIISTLKDVRLFQHLIRYLFMII